MALELAAVARPRRHLGFRRRRGQHRGPVRRRSGAGTATATRGRSTRSSRSRPSRPTGRAAAALEPFGAVPPLVTDIDLSVDDRFLYVSCWATGELKQYDVTDPPTRARRARCASAASSAATAHPARPDLPLAGGPQMVEVSRDGRRVYLTNSLYGAWDDQFYPDGVGAWMAKIDADPDGRHHARPSGSSRTATTSAACGCTRPGCRAATRPPTRTATADPTHPGNTNERHPRLYRSQCGGTRR